MPIKKSYLEKKWYYRVAKVIFLALPLLIVVFALVKSLPTIQGLFKGGFAAAVQNNVIPIVYAVVGVILYYVVLNAVWRLAVYVAFGGLVDDTKPADKGKAAPKQEQKPIEQLAPLLVLVAVVIVYALAEANYIRLPKISGGQLSGHTYGAACKNSSGKTGLYGTDGGCYTCSGGIVSTKSTGKCSGGSAGIYCCSAGTDGGNGVDGCISTGCANLWYCSGSYYIGDMEIRVPGLCYPVHPREIYPSWTGTCRQCP